MCTIYKDNKIFVLTCRYLGNIFKVQCEEYSIDVLCEDFVSCIVYKKRSKTVDKSSADNEIFYTGLKNGKLIEWHIKPDLNDDKKLQIKEKKNMYCHRGEITCIEIYENQNVLITGGKDKKIFIRKVHDLELLTAIDLTYCYMNDIISQNIDIIPTLIKASELNVIYVLLYNNDSGKSFIRAYNLNGLFITQSEEDNFMNICFTKNYNLLVSYYGLNEIKILNCYDLNETNIELYVNKLVEECEKGNNKRESKGVNKENDDFLVWNDYDSKDHEFILLFKNKIVRGNIKDKYERKNLEVY
jgi:WD40 repeat protein